MIEGKTQSGFSFKIDEKKFRDARNIKMLAKIENNPILLPDVVEVFLGEEQNEKLYAFIEKEMGYVDVERLGIIFNEIMVEVGKNNEEIKK